MDVDTAVSDTEAVVVSRSLGTVS